jgi:hypothetical protein
VSFFFSLIHSQYIWPLVGCIGVALAAANILRLRKSKKSILPPLPSWFLSSLDAGDRKFLFWCVGIALGLAVITGIVTPSGEDDNPLPSSYLTGRHGALAAYETLQGSGYPIERWERPLSELAATAGPETVVIFAQPMLRDTDDIKAIRQILERGGRVLATGLLGGFMLPQGSPESPKELNFAACQLEPNGLDALASTGEVWMVPQSGWQLGKPTQRVEYTCAGQAAVVEFDWGKGHAVWWAGSTPLENGSLARGRNLDLLLNSLGSREGHKFYWDESLHGDIRSTWSFADSTALRILVWSLPVLALVIIWSFSRRSGPVRALPGAVRTTPIEFVEALGSLYRKAGASSTAVAVAWERFRRRALALCGMRRQRLSAAELAVVIRRRFPNVDEALDADLAATEGAAKNDALAPREALRLVQLLDQHLEELKAAAKLVSKKPVSAKTGAATIEFQPQERGS